MNLTDGTTLLMALIKRAKPRINEKIKFTRDTKQRIRKISRNNSWNTQVVQILREEFDGKFLFKENMLSILPKSVEQSHEWVLTKFKYQEPEFYATLFDELKRTFLSPSGAYKERRKNKNITWCS